MYLAARPYYNKGCTIANNAVSNPSQSAQELRCTGSYRLFSCVKKKRKARERDQQNSMKSTSMKKLKSVGMLNELDPLREKNEEMYSSSGGRKGGHIHVITACPDGLCTEGKIYLVYTVWGVSWREKAMMFLFEKKHSHSRSTIKIIFLAFETNVFTVSKCICRRIFANFDDYERDQTRRRSSSRGTSVRAGCCASVINEGGAKCERDDSVAQEEAGYS